MSSALFIFYNKALIASNIVAEGVGKLIGGVRVVNAAAGALPISSEGSIPDGGSLPVKVPAPVVGPYVLTFL